MAYDLFLRPISLRSASRLSFLALDAAVSVGGVSFAVFSPLLLSATEMEGPLSSPPLVSPRVDRTINSSWVVMKSWNIGGEFMTPLSISNVR